MGKSKLRKLQIDLITGNYNPIILRKLQIDLITGDYNPIIYWFNDLWTRIYSVQIDIFHTTGSEIIYYTADQGDRKYIFYYDRINFSLWCNTERYYEYYTFTPHFEIENITRFLFTNIANQYMRIDSINYANIFKIDQILREK